MLMMSKMTELLMRNVSRFCLRAHTLAAGSSIWRSGNGHCDKCSCATVQNEVNVPFSLSRLVCVLFQKKVLVPFFLVKDWQKVSVNPFLWRPLIFHMPCLVRLSLNSFSTALIQWTMPFHLGHYGL